MRLAHLHLPGITPFIHASHIQQTLVTRLLTHKKLHESPTDDTSQAHPPSTPSAPDPTILTFTPNPVYTTGRRDLPNPVPETSSTSNIEHLPAPLTPIRHLLTSSPPVAEFHPTLRGGQTTYHGPGQLVAYTILDLRRLRIGPRAHIQLLEDSVIDVLRAYGVKGTVNQEPGVWVERVGSSSSSPSLTGVSNGRSGDVSGDPDSPRKITAVGVHLRRFVSSYGIGLNVTEEPMWFFRQIVACGLEGREATSLEGEGARGVAVQDVAERFVSAFVARVNEGSASKGTEPKIEEVYEISEKDVLH